MSTSIQTGNVVVDLMKPIDYYGYWLSQDLGRAVCHVLTRFIPTFLVGSLLYDVASPSSLARWPLFAISVLLAVLVSFAFRFMLNAAAFWMTDVAGIRAIALVATNFLSGLLVPLTFFPPWLRTIAELHPFRALITEPIDVFLGGCHPRRARRRDRRAGDRGYRAADLRAGHRRSRRARVRGSPGRTDGLMQAPKALPMRRRRCRPAARPAPMTVTAGSLLPESAWQDVWHPLSFENCRIIAT
jgi:hypothetical protein